MSVGSESESESGSVSESVSVSDSDSVPDDPPPLLGTWRRVYALVLIELGVIVLVLYALARWAA